MQKKFLQSSENKRKYAAIPASITYNLKIRSINHVPSLSEVDSYLALNLLLTEAITFKQLSTYM